MRRVTDVFLDMDGLFVDFVGGALAALGATAADLKPGEWHIERCLGITPAKFWERCSGHIFWESLRWMPDGVQVVEAAEAFAADAGANLWVYTSPSDDIGSFSGKYAWMKRHLPRLARSLVLCCNKASMRKPGGLLIDDNDGNCAGWRGDFRTPGGDAVLMPRFWNSEHDLAGRDNAGSIAWLKRRLDWYKASLDRPTPQAEAAGATR